MNVPKKHGSHTVTDDGVTCPACGAGTLRAARIPYEVSFRDRAFTVPQAEVMLCDPCGEVFFAPGQSDALQRAASDAARVEMGLVAGADIARFRVSQGLTQAQLETALDVPAKTVARWEIGSVLQSRAADRFLRVLMAHPELVTELLEGTQDQPKTADTVNSTA